MAEQVACDALESCLDYGEDLTTAAVVDALDAATASSNRVQLEVMDAIVRCDARGVWRDDDCRDFPHWLALRYGVTIYKAKRWVACAWALPLYPSFRAACGDGRLSIDKLVELTRLAGAVSEPERKLLSWALKVSIASIRERADAAIRVADEESREAQRQRSVTWHWDQDRTFVNLHASLPADMGVRVTSALDRLARKLPVSPEDYGAGEGDEDALDARRADALDLLAGHSIASNADADRATVVVHAPLSALVEGDCNAMGSDGVAFHPEVLSRLVCDGRLEPVVNGDGGAVVGIGTTSRVIPRWLRRAIEQRDGFRCTFPNCGSKLGLDCHHVVAWPHGPTDADNLVLLCRTHHRLVHEFGWHVTMTPDQSTTWFRPDWTPYVPRPPSPRTSGARCRRPSIPSRSRPSRPA